MKAAILTLALGAALLPEQSQPFDFQGVALDSKYADVSGPLKAAQCRELDSKILCKVPDAKVLDSLASLEYHFENITPDKKLYKIDVYLLNDDAGSKALSGLSAKWGEPEPDYRRYVWRRGVYKITLIQVVGGAAITYLNRDMKDVVDKKAAVKAASDL